MASPPAMYLSTDYGKGEHISNCHICYDFLAFGVGFGNKGERGSKATLTGSTMSTADAEEFR